MKTIAYSLRASLMLRHMALSVLAALFLVLLHNETNAQIQSQPNVISYQGSVTANGSTLTGDHIITTTIYTDPSGTTPVWSGSYKQTVSSGIFTVLLGSGSSPLPPSEDFSKPHWVGIKIDGGAELRPLTQLSASPYALSVPDKSITKEKIGSPYVSSIKLNGKPITGNGTDLNLKDGYNTYLEYDSLTGSLVVNVDQTINATPQNHVTADYWGEMGNFKVNPADGFFLGTIGDTAFEIHVFNNDGTTGAGDHRVVRYDPGILSPNITAGYKTNTIKSTSGCTIAGGGDSLNINFIDTLSDFGFIGSGAGNSIYQSSDHSVIGGGENNYIDIYSDHSVIGGGENNNSIYPFGFIGGGQNNQIAGGLNDVIGGGKNNIAGGSYGAVVGGDSNFAVKDHTFVGGGTDNRAVEPYSLVVGGYNNLSVYNYSSVGGGINNSIWSSDATIAGGNSNSILNNADYGFIGGGLLNNIDSVVAYYCTISGGDSNCISGNSGYSSILGGAWNQINLRTAGTTNNTFATIGGGSYNFIEAAWSFIGGGWSNHIAGDYSNRLATIGGGSQNFINGLESTIGGGGSNTDTAQFDFIGGGSGNTVSSSFGTIGGGWENLIKGTGDFHRLATIGGGSQNQTNGFAAAITGGGSNQANNDFAAICGGSVNIVSGTESFIGGGITNSVISNNSAIAGGDTNTIFSGATDAFIGGGQFNRIDVNADHATIGGGDSNYVNTPFGAILGGKQNRAFRIEGTVLSGENNNADLAAQSVTGFWKKSWGTTFPTDTTNAFNATSPMGTHVTDDYNTPLFVVGNGKSGSTHNAAEISYNGHLTVYDQNGTGSMNPAGGRGAIIGTTYSDNVLNAWGIVTVAGGAATMAGDFGVAGVEYKGTGCYRVWLNQRVPQTTTPGSMATLSTASITANAICDTICTPTGKIVEVSSIQTGTLPWAPSPTANFFEVTISRYAGSPATPALVDNSFAFKVSGR